MTVPDFIGIGMERAGSSWLFYMLASHPDVWVPPIKELHYFDSTETLYSWRFKKHLKSRIFAKTAPFLKSPEERPQLFKNSWREYLEWDLRYFAKRKTHDWYRALFDRKFTKGRLSGEITARYATIPEDIIQDIAKNFPDTKIILSVRDPAERTISALIYHFRGIKKRKLSGVLETEMLTWLEKHEATLEKSSNHTVSIWQKHIKPENLILIDFNDIAIAPEDLIRYLYTRLGLDTSFQPPQALVKRKIFSFRDGTEELPDTVMNKVLSIHKIDGQPKPLKKHIL